MIGASQTFLHEEKGRMINPFPFENLGSSDEQKIVELTAF